MQRVEHDHLQVVVAHGEITVFRHDEVETDDSRITCGEFEAKERLREDLLGWKAAQHLVQVEDFYRASDAGLGCAAVLAFGAAGVDLVELFAIERDFCTQTGGEELVARLENVLWCVAGPADLIAEFGCVGERWGVHGFDVLLVLLGGARGDFIDPLAYVALMDAAEAVEGVKKLIVSANPGGRNEVAHGECVDQRVIEMLVFQSIAHGNCARSTCRLWLEEGHGRGGDAEIVFHSILNECFRVDSAAAEVQVQVAALGHALQKVAELQRVLLCLVECANCPLLRG